MTEHIVNQAVVAIFAGILVVIAVGDIRRLVIPNTHTMALALLYPAYVLTAPTPVDWTGAVIVASASLAIGYVMYAWRLAGGGDIKFFAAVALWAGLALLLHLIIVMSLVGGVIGVIMLIHRRLKRGRPSEAQSALPARAVAASNFFLGQLLLSRSRVAAAAPSAATPIAVDDARGGQSDSVTDRPVGSLPYGVAIAAGGLAIAVLLLKG